MHGAPPARGVVPSNSPGAFAGADESMIGSAGKSVSGGGKPPSMPPSVPGKPPILGMRPPAPPPPAAPPAPMAPPPPAPPTPVVAVPGDLANVHPRASPLIASARLVHNDRFSTVRIIDEAFSLVTKAGAGWTCGSPSAHVLFFAAVVARVRPATAALVAGIVAAKRLRSGRVGRHNRLVGPSAASLLDRLDLIRMRP